MINESALDGAVRSVADKRHLSHFDLEELADSIEVIGPGWISDADDNRMERVASQVSREYRRIMSERGLYYPRVWEEMPSRKQIDDMERSGPDRIFEINR